MNLPKNPSEKSPLRILFIGNFLSEKGVSVQPCEFLSHLFESDGYIVLRTSLKRNKFIRFYDMLTTIMTKRREYAIAHIDTFSGQAFFWAESGAMLLKYLRKPFVVTLHGGNLPQFSRRHPKRVAKLLSSANAVMAPSEYLKDKLAKFREDIRVIPNGLDIAPYPFRLRQQPGPSMIWLRAFHNIYNPQMAVDVVACLIGDFPGLHLQMIGPDKDGGLLDVQTIAEEKGVTRHIDFPGRIEKSDVPLRLNEADIFINTTNIDNTPVSVIEAMACGMCVVSTDVGGLPYLLEDGTDALLVPANDAAAMAAAVKRILTEPGLAASLSKNARAKAEKFDWSIVLPQWKQLFFSMVESEADSFRG